MAKPGSYAARMGERKRIENEHLILMQGMAVDAALLAAHEVFGLGPGRAKKFYDTVRDELTDIFMMIMEDKKTDRELNYTFSVINRKIQQIMGDDYIDEKKRYEPLTEKEKK